MNQTISDQAKTTGASAGNAEHRCLACGRVFSCGLEGGGKSCWCMEEPARIAMPQDADAACYCPQCLEARLPAAT